MKKIAVIFGGISPEHDVSIITGCLVLNSLDKNKFSPVPIYVTKEGEWLSGDSLFNVSVFKNLNLKKCKRVLFAPPTNELRLYKNNKPLFSVAGVINCMHGGLGEGGAIRGFFELCDIPTLSSPMLSAALSMDKWLTKTLLKALSVKTVDGVKVLRRDFYKDRAAVISDLKKQLDFPVIVKPARTGSSIGVELGKDFDGVEKALLTAFKYDDKVVVEKYLTDFTEINCAAYAKDGKTEVSLCEKPVSFKEILTFNDKYAGAKDGGERREFPAKISKEISDEIRQITKIVYEAFEFSSIVRMDFLLQKNEVYLNEINSVPGSFAYYLFSSKISGLTDLLTDLLEETFKNYLSKKGSITYFKSSVLSLNGAACKK